MSTQAHSFWRGVEAAMLLGAAQGASAPALPDGLADVVPGEGPAGILAATAAVTVYRMASAEPVPGFTPYPAMQTEESVCTIAAADLLAQILEGKTDEYGRGGSAEMLREWLIQAEQAGRHVPPEMLPLLLSRYADGRERPWSRRGLGARATWLANLTTAHEVATDQWETGGLAARRDYLRTARLANPTAARDLLKQAWPNERADVRKTLLETFETGLSPEDEAFFEAALDDRSREVCEVAQNLLSALPGSAYAGRLASYARQAVFLDMGPSGPCLRLESLMPDPAMSRDGYDVGTYAHRPVSYIIVSQVRMDTWADHPPSTWIKAALVSEDHSDLIDMWVEAAAKHGDRKWLFAVIETILAEVRERRITQNGRAEPILAGTPRFRNSKHDGLFVKALAAIKHPDAEPLVRRIIAGRPWILLLGLAVHCEWNWSPDFSRFVFEQFHRDAMASIRAGRTQDISHYRDVARFQMFAHPSCEALVRTMADDLAKEPQTESWQQNAFAQAVSTLLACADVMRTRLAIAQTAGEQAA